MRDASRESRLTALDGLRGVLAASVVLFHSFGALGFTTEFILPGLGWMWNGRAAVNAFFTISGFALAWPLIGKSGIRWGQFLIRRFVRLYLPYAAIVLLASALFLNFSVTLPNLLLVDRLDEVGNDVSIWSIIQEFRVSLLFPLFFLLVMRCGIIVPIASIAVFAACIGAGAADTVVRTASCAMFFNTGLYFATRWEAIEAAKCRLQPTTRWLMLAIVLVGLSFDPSVFRTLPWQVVIHASSAALLLVMPPLLETRIPQLLGRVSFSLYLVHEPVIAFTYPLLHPYLGTGPAILVAWLAVAAACFLFYKIIEEPTVALSRRISIRAPAPALKGAYPVR
jgi:peptidoglycan/LPS O-acetylase OafA/YrhL